jgi:hypothetical protein
MAGFVLLRICPTRMPAKSLIFGQNKWLIRAVGDFVRRFAGRVRVREAFELLQTGLGK